MEPESPSPYPQVPATCPYLEPTSSSPHDPLPNFPKIQLNIILPSTSWSPHWPLSIRLAAVTSKMKIVGYVFRTMRVVWCLLRLYICWHNRFIRCHNLSLYCDGAICLMPGFWRCPLRTSTKVPSILAEFFVCFRTFSRNTPWYLKLGHDRLFYPSVGYILHQELTIWRDVATNADSILK
jgi:hypothetical protein